MSENTGNFIKSNREQIVYAALLVLVLVIYWQTVGFGFINLDDNLYVYDNARIANGLTKDAINWAFSAFYSANWHPLTWLSHAFDIQLFGLNAGGHHAVNVFIHLLNSILSFIVFRKLTGSFWKSAIVAALFAVHPAHVESVAWISERKDVLSTMFWLLTMLVYLKYAETEKFLKTEQNDGKAKQISPVQSSFLTSTIFLLGCTTFLFALGLMAKPMLVTLPFVLLLCDFWALERLKTLKDLPSLIIEKLPLFVLSIISSYLTIMAQKFYGAVETLEVLSVQTRIANAVVAYAKYLITFFYPANLAVWYPYDKNISALQIIGSIVLLATITVLCVWQIRKRKYFLMGWLWFLGTLVPVIGLVQVGSQSMADRYTYVPFFGIFVIVVWGISDILKKFDLNKILVPIFGIVIVIFTALSFIQTTHWRNSETLYRHTLAVTKNNHLIAHNLCHSLMLEERLNEALPLCLKSIEYNPNYYSVYNTLGTVQTKLGKFAEAEQSFRAILSQSPDYTIVYTNLSVALSMQGKTQEAEEFLKKATEMNDASIPRGIWINSFNSLAIAFASQKQYEKATENFARTLFIAPERSDVRANYALTLSSIQKYDEAEKQIEESIRQNPNIAEFYNVYGVVLLGKTKKADAAKQFEKALQLKPDFNEAKSNLEKAKNDEK